MKTLRLFTIALLAVLIMSTWAPFPAYAKPSTPTTVDAKVKLANLTVVNRTGGTLYVSLAGPRYYSFSTSKQGKTVFKGIEAGRYTITVRTSGCAGMLTYKKNVKGSFGLKPFVCRYK